MYEERRLVAVGFPLDEAAGICWALRREGGLEEFVARQEQDYRERESVRVKHGLCEIRQ